MKRKLLCIIILILALLLLSACTAKTVGSPDLSSSPDTGKLTAQSVAGSWELFEPKGVWASKLDLSSDGKLTIDGASGSWSLSNDTLTLKAGDSMLMKFKAVMEGYYLILENEFIDYSVWYINPALFAQGAVDAAFTGSWLNAGGNDSITISPEGDFVITDLSTGSKVSSKYFARDSIARVYNETEGVQYYSYSIGDDNGMLMLTQYDSTGGTEKYYYPQLNASDYAGTWKRVALNSSEAFIEEILLNEDKTGHITGGSYEGDITWNIFGSGLMVLTRADGTLIDLYSDVLAGSMYISDNNSLQAMFVCDAQMRDSLDSLTGLVGNWQNGDATVSASFTADKKMTFSVKESETSRKVYEGEAIFGTDIIKLTTAELTLYLTYQLDDSGENLNIGFIQNVISDSSAGYWSLVRTD